jgi:hypothetical protein
MKKWTPSNQLDEWKHVTLQYVKLSSAIAFAFNTNWIGM